MFVMTRCCAYTCSSGPSSLACLVSRRVIRRSGRCPMEIRSCGLLLIRVILRDSFALGSACRRTSNGLRE